MPKRQQNGVFTGHSAVLRSMAKFGSFRTFYYMKFVIQYTSKNMQYSLFDIMWLTGNGE